MGYTPLYMNVRRLHAEAELHGCEFIEHHPVWRIYTLKHGDRWTYLRNPETQEPIGRIREIGITEWKDVIAESAAYLKSDDYIESKPVSDAAERK